MRGLLRWIGGLLLGACAGVALAAPPAATSSPTCQGTFLNPITDVCWSCMFPIKVGGVALLSMGQEDTGGSGGNPFCFCTGPGLPTAGIKVEFWEPARLFEAVRKPHCYPSLGGVVLDPGVTAPSHNQKRIADGEQALSFYQAHWYTNPIMYWLEVIADDPCLEQGSFDLAYATEFDPLWNDTVLSFVLAPESALFANPLAKAACAADCVSATMGFPLNTLFWCVGCQGSMYPLTGYVAQHVGGVQASALLAARMANKLHKQGLMWAGSGDSGLCGFYPQLLMDKTNYKMQLTYPVPQTAKIDGRCCQPIGRTTVDYGAGKEIPYIGEDFAYQVFRKRSCCSGSAVWQTVNP